MANIKNYLDNIKKALFGKDVRSSIHDGIDAINKETERTTAKQEYLEKTFDNLIINAGNSNAEIVDARTDKNTNKTYAKVGDRIDGISSQLSEKTIEINVIKRNVQDVNLNLTNKINEVAEKGTTVEVLEETTKKEIDRQIADGTIANLKIGHRSITNDKYGLGSIDSKALKYKLAKLIEKGKIKLDLSTNILEIKQCYYILDNTTLKYTKTEIQTINFINNNGVAWVCHVNSENGEAFYEPISNNSINENSCIIFIRYLNSIWGNENFIDFIDSQGEKISQNERNIPFQPAIGFSDLIEIDEINKKIKFPSGVAVTKEGYKSFKSFAYEIPSDLGYIDTIYFDTGKLKNNENPILRARYGGFYAKNNNCFPLGVVSSGRYTSYYPFKIIQKNIIIDKNKDRLIIANDIYTINNEILPLYKKSILATNKNYSIFETCFIDEEKGIFDYFENYNINNNSNDLKIGLKFDDVTILKDIKNKTRDNILRDKSLKILNIGDSLTEGGLSKYLKDELIKHGANPTFIGSRNISGVKSEGRGGWMSSNYTGMRGITGTGGKVVISGDPGTNKNTNPFLVLATEEDKQQYPNFCFRLTQSELEKNYSDDTDKTGDFYIFNFKKYLEQYCYNQAPDIVTIGLGTNDVWKYGTNEIINYLKNIKFMINRILEVNPNCKIGLVPPPATATSSKAFYEGFGKLIEETLKKYYSEWNNIKDLIIPVWQHMNRDYIFSVNKIEDLNFCSSGSIYQISDHVHFNKYGYYQYVKVLSAWINYVLK